MTKLDELIAAREDVIKAYEALSSLDVHELYSVRINSPFEFLKDSNLVEITQNMRESIFGIWRKLDVAIDNERARERDFGLASRGVTNDDS